MGGRLSVRGGREARGGVCCRGCGNAGCAECESEAGGRLYLGGGRGCCAEAEFWGLLVGGSWWVGRGELLSYLTLLGEGMGEEAGFLGWGSPGTVSTL